jgi:hypothetical protein
MAGRPTKVGALAASHLLNPLPRAKAANGVTGYHQATVIPVGGTTSTPPELYQTLASSDGCTW